MNKFIHLFIFILTLLLLLFIAHYTIRLQKSDCLYDDIIDLTNLFKTIQK